MLHVPIMLLSYGKAIGVVVALLLSTIRHVRTCTALNRLDLISLLVCLCLPGMYRKVYAHNAVAVLRCPGVPGRGGRSRAHRGRVRPRRCSEHIAHLGRRHMMVINCGIDSVFLSLPFSPRGTVDTTGRLQCLAPSCRICSPSSATSW